MAEKSGNAIERDCCQLSALSLAGPPPSVSLRSPPTPGKGWAGNMEERTTPLSLASHSLRGEGDHEVVAGYKTHRPQGDTTTL